MSAVEPRRWGEIKALFQEAILLRLEERDRFLTRACGEDTDLRSEVESLLASHDDQRPFLDQSPIAGAAHVLAEGLDATERPSLKLQSGTWIGQYEVLERLGAGGMGEVYRALDTKLDRFVALKIVDESAATGPSAVRVIREARAASALNHPNICTIYEVGEVDGRPYLAMEYIAGQSLNRLIPPEGLSATDLVHYAVQIADAVAHAHEHGVIHRDLKAANVVVTPKRRAKVLDFGLAKRLTAVGADSQAGSLAAAGMSAGTPAYMAPELFRGHAADARSDIWALGVLLYEMASGRRPFAEQAPFQINAAPAADRPPPLSSRVSGRLQAVVYRCLAQDPADRFQRASDLVSALERTQASTGGGSRSISLSRRTLLAVGAAAGLLVVAYGASDWRARPSVVAPPATSVAVLPFRIVSGAEELGFLAIGLPDALISRLGLVPGLRVRPTSSVLVWEKESVEAQHAGRMLSVEYVLTGTVERRREQIRVTPQLVRVADGAGLWTRPFTISPADLLGLQSRIAGAVVEALAIEMTGADRASVYRRYTQNPDAYRWCVRGRSQLARSRPDSAAAAFESFQAALAHDPDYALAHAGAAAASAQMRLFFATEAEVAVWETRAHQAAQRALQIDPTLPEAHEALAAVYRHAEFDWHQAIEESDRALALNPNLDQPHLYRASAFSHLGLLDRVPAAATAAAAINPASISEPLRVQGVTAMFAGRFAEAVALLEQVKGASGKLSADWNLANAYYYAGRQADAEAMLRDLRGSARSERRAQATLASFLAARGEAAEARKLIHGVTSASYMDHHVAYALGAAYAQLGVPTEALRWLTQARSTGFPCYPWFEHDPLLGPMKRSPAFRLLLEELRRSWETARVRHQARR